MKIGDCMKRNVISVSAGTTLRAAALTLSRHHIGTLPVVDEKNHLVGLIRFRDLLNLAMPDFVNLVDHLDFVHDFGAVENQIPGQDLLDMRVDEVMKVSPSVEQTAGLLRTTALLDKHQLSDIPVVDEDNCLIGIASYVDIGTAMVFNWHLSDG